MTISDNLGAYDDCIELFETALRAKVGIRIACARYGDANHLHVRMHYTRKLLRDKSMASLPSDDPRYNTSPYDALIVRKARQIDGKWWVYIEQRALDMSLVEELDANTTTGRAFE